MFCISCGGKLEVVDVVRDLDDVYRRRKCKSCGKLVFTFESEVEPTDSFRAAWNECNRNIRNRNKGEKK